MSVISSDGITSYPAAGQSDPRLPAGIWTARTVATGDASAGTVRLSAILASSGLGGLRFPVYSIEQLMCWREDATAENPIVQFRRFNYGHGLAGINRRATMESIQGAGNYLSKLSEGDSEVYLGTAVPDGGNASEIRVTWNTNTNTVQYVLFARGRYWAADSLTQPGGPMFEDSRTVAEIGVSGGQSYYARLRAGPRASGLSVAPRRRRLRAGQSTRR